MLSSGRSRASRQAVARRRLAIYAARMIASVVLPGGVLLRPLNSGDAPALLDAYVRNREHLRPSLS